MNVGGDTITDQFKGMSGSMFPNLAAGPKEGDTGMFSRIPSMATPGEPSPEEVEAAADRARHSRQLYITSVKVMNFNLSDKNNAAAYCELYQRLYNEVSLKTVFIKDIYKEFITWILSSMLGV